MADTSNEFDGAAAQVMQSQASNIRNNVYNAVPQNPAQVAEHSKIAGVLGIPVDSVAADPTVARQQAAMQNFDADKMVSNYPHLAQFLGDPLNAAKSHTDLPTLAATEQAVKGLPNTVDIHNITDGSQFPAAVGLPDQAPSLRDRLTDYVANIFGTQTAEQQRQQSNAAQANAILVGRSINPDLTPAPGASPSEIQSKNDQAWELSRKAIGGSSQIPDMAAEQFMKAMTFGLGKNTVETQPHSWQASTAGAGGQLAGFIAGPAKLSGALLGEAPVIADGASWATHLIQEAGHQAAVLGLASGLEQSGSAILDSHSADEAEKKIGDSMLSGAATGATFGAAGRLLPENTLAQYLGRFLGVSAAQDAMNGQTPWDDRSLQDKIFNYGLNAFFTLNGPGKVDGKWFPNMDKVRDIMPRIQEQFQTAEKVQEATKTRDVIQGVSDLAQKSTLLKNDPKAFHDFVSSVTDDGQAPKEVWINGQTLVDSFHQAGITEDQFKTQLPDVFDQLHEALQTGGDVRIPLADYATHISVSPLNDVIMDYLKTDPEGLTYKEGQQLLSEQKESMTKQAQDLVQKQAALDERSKQLKAITDDVQRQLEATGRFPSSVAKEYSALHGAWYDTMSERMGISPDELRAIRPLPTITGDEKTKGKDWLERNSGSNSPRNQANPALVNTTVYENPELGNFYKQDAIKQTETPEFKAWFGDSKAIDEFGNPLVLYHGTGNDISKFSMKKSNDKEGRNAGLGLGKDKIYLSGNKSAASDYAENAPRRKLGSSPNVMPLFASIKKPISLEDYHKQFAELSGGKQIYDSSLNMTERDSIISKLDKKLKNEGVDGIIEHVKTGQNTYKIGQVAVFEPSQLKSSIGNNGNFDPNKSEVYHQNKNLIAQHNLSSENLLHADRIGGLPVPSLAVTTKENPIKGFGDITLLADKGLINPKDGAKVFGSDIYSPRYPEVDVKLDKYALKGLNNKLKEFQDGREIYSSDIESAKDLTRDKAFEKYAESKGVNVNSYHDLKALAEETLRDVGAKERIFKGRDDNGYAKYADHTIDNVVKILKKDLRGGENFNYGVGNIRSKVSPQFKSIEQIKKSQDLLVSEKDFESVKEEINKEFFKVAEGMEEFHPASNRFGFLDTVSSTMQDAATMGLPKALKENGFSEVPEAKQQEIVEFMNKLKDLPTAYFEAKLLRSVGLDEFKGAVVPHDVDPKVIKALNDKGITDIKTYQSGDESDRTAKIGEFEHLLFQESRGAYSPDSNTLALLKDADLSTFLHESGHFFLEGMHDLAKLPEAPKGIKQDFDTLLQHFKVAGETPEERMANWSSMDLNAKREGHESFANGFEDYLMTGKAPTPELQSLFSRFRSWLLNLYQAMRGEVSPEVKGVMDRMLASEQSIAEAEKVQAYAIPNLPVEAGQLAEDYKKLGKEATDQAISEMQARSMRDMKWSTNAKNKMIKSMQREAIEKRAAIRREVIPEIMKQPVYRVWTFLTAKHGDLVEGEKVKEISKSAINPDEDNIFTAISKLGGLKHDAVEKAWGVTDSERRKINEYGTKGKPVVHKTGGVEVDEMAEKLAREGYLTEDEHGKADISEFESMFEDQRRGVDRYSFHRDMEQAYGDGLKPLPDLPEMAYGKLSTQDIEYMFGTGKDEAWRKLENLKMTSKKTGLDPQIVAELFGMDNGRDLVKSLIAAEDPKTLITKMVDQRMLERHGDLTDPVSVERAAEGAIHNEVRSKMMATGLKMFTKSPMSVREINQAAKVAAETAIAQKQVGDLRPTQYSAAEAKANKELLKLAPKDPEGAAKAQREALLNNRLFKASTDAISDIQKGLTYFKRFNKESLRNKIDLDVRDQIDNLLSRFDLRQNPSTEPTRGQLNLEKWITSQMEAGYSPTVTAEMLAPEFKKPYKNMTVEEFKGLVDTIKSIEHMGRQRNMLTVDGQKQQVADYVKNELIPKLQERGERFSTDEIYTRREDRDISKFTFAMDKLSSGLRALHAQLTPQEYKRNAFDRHDILGPFGKAIFDPIIDANYNKVRMLKGLSDDFAAKAEELGKEWQKSLTEFLHNDKLIDAIATKESGSSVFMKMSRGKMIGMAIHVGNESNFHKLTEGYGWEPVKVWEFLHDNMTAKDWQAVQHVWDLYEKHWPQMEAMYRRLGQTTPDKVEARSFHTPFGEMRGGYAAITYDALRSRRGEKDAANQAINPSEGLFNRDYFSRKSTTNGSMNARVEGYTDAIDLNFHTIEQSMHESIHDLAYREALIDANKIVENADFRREFFKAYGREEYKAIQDWMGRIANSDNSDRAVGALGRLLQYTRTGMVMNAIALRATTVLKHGGSAGIKTLGYFSGDSKKYLASRIAAMGHDYTNQIESAKEKFGEINARLLQQDRDYRATASSLFEPEGLKSRAERFGHAAVAWSDMMTAVPTAWAAYDRAITEGIPIDQGGTGKPMTEKQAVSYANKIVREAHGSNVESARSNIMTAPSEVIKTYTMLYGFMNNTYGQIADSVNKFQTPGMAKPEILARTFMAIIVPGLWAGWLSEGGLKEGENIFEWAAKAITGEVAGTVPLVRDAYSMIQDNRNAGVVGAESWISRVVRGGKDVVQLAQGKEPKKLIQDVADAAGMGLHIPGLGQIGKSLQYMRDVSNGEQQPANALEYAQGMVVGGHKK